MSEMSSRYEMIYKYSNDPNAYALLQSEMDYFHHGDSFLAFRKSNNTPVVLNDPVAEPDKLESLIRLFTGKEKKSIFVNISQEFASMLNGYGLEYRFCPYGTENIIDLSSSTYMDSKKIKSALKKARKVDLKMNLIDFNSISPEKLELLKTINQEFLDHTPSKKEITFISRGVELKNLQGVKFYELIYVEGERNTTFGFIVLDPYFSNGDLTGYQLNAIRFRRTRIWGVYYSVVALLAKMLKEEGFSSLSLGGLALDMFDVPSPFPHDKKMVKRITSLGKKADKYYVVSNFTEMKLEFHGDRIRRYLAIPRDTSVSRSIFKFLRVSGMI